MRGRPSALYHFTCQTGYLGIVADRMVRPSHHPFLGVRLCWFTTDPDPQPEHLGFGDALRCDRMAMRVQAITPGLLVPWLAWAGEWQREEAGGFAGIVRRSTIRTMSAQPARPKTWWVSERPIGVAPSPITRWVKQ